MAVGGVNVAGSAKERAKRDDMGERKKNGSGWGRRKQEELAGRLEG